MNKEERAQKVKNNIKKHYSLYGSIIRIYILLLLVSMIVINKVESQTLNTIIEIVRALEIPLLLFSSLIPQLANQDIISKARTGITEYNNMQKVYYVIAIGLVLIDTLFMNHPEKTLYLIIYIVLVAAWFVYYIVFDMLIEKMKQSVGDDYVDVVDKEE